VILDGTALTVDQVVRVARGRAPVRIAPAALERVVRSRETVERALAAGQVV